MIENCFQLATILSTTTLPRAIRRNENEHEKAKQGEEQKKKVMEDLCLLS